MLDCLLLVDIVCQLFVADRGRSSAAGVISRNSVPKASTVAFFFLRVVIVSEAHRNLCNAAFGEHKLAHSEVSCDSISVEFLRASLPYDSNPAERSG